jgi:hypothetical protein
MFEIIVSQLDYNMEAGEQIMAGVQVMPGVQPQANYEIFYVLVEAPGKEMLSRALGQIAFTYATFKFFHYCEDLQKAISSYYHDIKLTKRKIIFAVVVPPENPEVCPIGCKRINLTPYPQSKEDLLLDETVEEGQLETELIKRFQLDSVWVGLVYRIGTDVEDLQEYL